MIPDRLRSNCFCGEKADVLGELQLIYRVRRLSLFLSKDIIPSLPSIYFFEPLFGHIIQAGHRHTIRAGTTSVIDGWLLEDITPSIDSLLEISYRLSVPLEILLMNEINESDLDVSKLLWHPKRRRQSCQLNVEKVIKICLEYYLGISPDVPSPSLKFVAEEIGCDLSTIRSHYPELASQISHNYVACQKEQTRVRHEEIEKTVRTAVESIVTSGGIPTLNEVKSIIPHVNVNPNGIGYQAWRKAINTQSDRCCPVY